MCNTDDLIIPPPDEAGMTRVICTYYAQADIIRHILIKHETRYKWLYKLMYVHSRRVEDGLS
jgi:hypothetical protein